MKNKIRKILANLEDEHDIEILYACESGSRAWGFSNYQSDYDIRFIYRYSDLKKYISLTPSRDVIEYMDNPFDIVGWDIKKALILHYKSNPSLREWLMSGDVYVEDNRDIFHDLGDFDISTLKHHYRSMALMNYRKYISDTFKNWGDLHTKKLLYITRCILSWKLLDDNIYPPINIIQLLNCCEVEISIRCDILNLISHFKTGSDIPDLNRLMEWIKDSLNKIENDKSKKIKNKDFNLYDERFHELLGL